MSKQIQSITNDQLDALCLPLGKAESLLLVLIDAMDDGSQMDTVYVARDLLIDVRKIAYDFNKGEPIEIKEGSSKTADELTNDDVLDLSLTIDEVSCLLNDANGLLAKLKTVLGKEAAS